MKLETRKIDGYEARVWEDEGGNAWYEWLLSEEAAEEKSKSLKDCTGCLNCNNLKGCRDCRGCSNCEDCEGCFYCRDCVGCKGCRECRGCVGCIGCEDCSGCDRCEGCIDCKDCTKCKDGKMLRRCRECAGCCLVYGMTHQPFHAKQLVENVDYGLSGLGEGLPGTGLGISKYKSSETVHFYYYEKSVILITEGIVVTADSFEGFDKKIDGYWNEGVRMKIRQQVNIFYGMYQILKLVWES